MLSYQHDYHAGGPADVHKHGSLAVILARMTAKDKPMSYIESHAGAGLYDLESPMAQKTGEALEGIGHLVAHGLIPEGHPYRTAVEQTQRQFGPSFYPGSPWIAQLLLREEDSIHLMELHPKTHASLRNNLRGKTIHIHHRDGYEGVLAVLPPTPRRCLIVIDPSYEVKTEYEQAGRFVLQIHRKCAEAVIVLWYPLLKDGLHPPLCRMLEQASLPRFARREVVITQPTETTRRLYGSGLVFVNIPYGVEESLNVVDRFVPRGRMV